MSRPTLFEALGGEAGVLRLAHAWHARVLADDVVAHAFSHGFHPRHTERLAAYWAEAWGGPPRYTEALGTESSVVRMHSGNGDHHEMDRRAIACFDQASLCYSEVKDGAVRVELAIAPGASTTFTVTTAAVNGSSQSIALSITGIPDAKKYFEPLVPGTFRVPNTNFYRAPAPYDTDIKAWGEYCADRIAEAIEFEGPDTVAAVFLEPVQNAGGCFPPPPGYFQRVREICDEYDVLLVSDEVICAYGRIGSMFACNEFDYIPDIITSAKGLTSGYSPLGAMIASDRLFEPFNDGKTVFGHGYTFGGHPVSAAVALANLDIFEREGLNDHVKQMAPAFRTTLEQLYELPIVGDIRGEGFFYGIELVKDRATKETFNDHESERLLRGFLTTALWEAGLYCRADDRGDPVVQLAPPLISGQKEFDEIYGILHRVLGEASRLL